MTSILIIGILCINLFFIMSQENFRSKVNKIQNLMEINHNMANSYALVQLFCGSNNEFSFNIDDQKSYAGCLSNKITSFPVCLKDNIQYVYGLIHYDDKFIKIFFGNSKCSYSYSNRYGWDTERQENGCENVLIGLPANYNYLDHQFNDFPIICKNGYKQNNKYNWSYAYCQPNNSWKRNFLDDAGPCIKACVDNNDTYNAYHLKEIEEEKLYLDCQAGYRKIITEDFFCVQTGYDEYEWKIGNEKLLNKNKNSICEIKTCPSLTSIDISTDIHSKRVTVDPKSCTNKIKNESCEYSCEEVATAKKPESIVRCTENKNGLMTWEGSAYCEKVCSNEPTKRNDSVISPNINSCENKFLGDICNYTCPEHSMNSNTEILTCSDGGWSHEYICKCESNYMPNSEKTSCILNICINAPEKEENSIIIDKISSCAYLKAGQFCSYNCPANSDKLSKEQIKCLPGNKWQSKYDCRCKKLYITGDYKESCQSKIQIYILGVFAILFVVSLLLFSFVCICRARRKSKRIEKEKKKEKERKDIFKETYA